MNKIHCWVMKRDNIFSNDDIEYGGTFNSDRVCIVKVGEDAGDYHLSFADETYPNWNISIITTYDYRLMKDDQLCTVRAGERIAPPTNHYLAEQVHIEFYACEFVPAKWWGTD